MGREICKLAWQLAAHADWQAQSGVRAIPQGIALPVPREAIAILHQTLS